VKSLTVLKIKLEILNSFIIMRVGFLLFFIVFLFTLFGCATLDYRDKVVRSATEEEVLALRQGLAKEAIVDSYKFLATTKIVMDNDNQPAFRMAVRAATNGDFTIQILPITSLSVIQTFKIDGEKGVLISGEGEETHLTERTLRYILGEVISAQDLYYLLLGRPGVGTVFSTWHNMQGKVGITKDGAIQYEDKTLYFVVENNVLSRLKVFDRFQGRLVLDVQYDDYLEIDGINVPSSVLIKLPTSSTEVAIKYTPLSLNFRQEI
jgi:hypothetical protein